jgi:hypothetical protein
MSKCFTLEADACRAATDRCRYVEKGNNVAYCRISDTIDNYSADLEKLKSNVETMMAARREKQATLRSQMSTRQTAEKTALAAKEAEWQQKNKLTAQEIATLNKKYAQLQQSSRNTLTAKQAEWQQAAKNDLMAKQTAWQQAKKSQLTQSRSDLQGKNTEMVAEIAAWKAAHAELAEELETTRDQFTQATRGIKLQQQQQQKPSVQQKKDAQLIATAAVKQAPQMQTRQGAQSATKLAQQAQVHIQKVQQGAPDVAQSAKALADAAEEHAEVVAATEGLNVQQGAEGLAAATQIHAQKVKQATDAGLIAQASAEQKATVQTSQGAQSAVQLVKQAQVHAQNIQQGAPAAVIQQSAQVLADTAEEHAAVTAASGEPQMVQQAAQNIAVATALQAREAELNSLTLPELKPIQTALVAARTMKKPAKNAKGDKASYIKRILNAEFPSDD